MTTIVTLLLSMAGFVMLSLSMDKHHRDIFGEVAARSRAMALRGVGWLFLTVSLLSAITGESILAGIVLWLGIATVAAIAVAMALTYGPWKRV